MNVSELMTKDVVVGGPKDSLQQAAWIMWEKDCGVVPVVNGDRQVIGMLTDRDICMAALTQGQPLSKMLVSSAMSRGAHSIGQNESLDAAELVMRAARVRRVPVLDGDGCLLGILSLNDLARLATYGVIGKKRHGLLTNEGVVQTLGAVCEPHSSVARPRPTTSSTTAANAGV